MDEMGAGEQKERCYCVSKNPNREAIGAAQKGDDVSARRGSGEGTLEETERERKEKNLRQLTPRKEVVTGRNGVRYLWEEFAAGSASLSQKKRLRRMREVKKTATSKKERVDGCIQSH